MWCEVQCDVVCIDIVCWGLVTFNVVFCVAIQQMNYGSATGRMSL